MASKLVLSELGKIDKFNGSNYDMWHRKIGYALIHDNIDDIIETTAPTLTDKSTPEEKKGFEQ